MIPLKNAIHAYRYCLFSLPDKPYAFEKCSLPEGWKRTACHPHSHDFPELWYCLKGEITIVINEITHKLKQWQFIVVPIGMVHQIITPKGTAAEYFSLKIRYDLFAPYPATKYPNAKTALFLHSFLKKDTPKPVTISKESKKLLHESFSKLYSNLSSSSSQEENCDIFEAMFSLPELYNEPIKSSHLERLWCDKVSPILRTIDYICEHHCEKILSSELLNICAMGATNFHSTFKTFLNQSFHAYLQQIRLLHCQSLIVSTSLPMSYIATLCGFSNQAHMIKNYKKYAKVLPGHAKNNAHNWIKAIANNEPIERI